MKKISIIAFTVLSMMLMAKPNYTAYSGAPSGSKGTCASSCHGSGMGTITISGMPAAYLPLTTYTISVKHSGGSTISNFNASSRKGATTTAAGVFGIGTNSSLYSVANYENGVRASANNINEAVFTWTAPAAGTGEVRMYLSGLQGSKSGATTKIVVSSTEQVTDVAEIRNVTRSFALNQNYPNPFNPATVISYQLSTTGHTTLKVFDMLGNEAATLVNEMKSAGTYSVAFNGNGLSSGMYFVRLQSGGRVETRKIILVK